jgi:hypothetical protein
MKSILDPSFRYTASFNTDLRKTFARIRLLRALGCETRTRSPYTAASQRIVDHQDTNGRHSTPRLHASGPGVEMRPPVACRLIAATALLLGALTTADAQLGLSISLPAPPLASTSRPIRSWSRCLAIPVYYAPQLNANYFFYDGMYWVYQRDNWYAATWYNGPWGLVTPEAVPVFILRVPVRYYRQSPAYFHGWRADAAPHWGEHWGETWERSHSGWNSGTRGTALAAAPLPGVPEAIRRKPVPARGTTAVIPQPALPLPAAGADRRAALPDPARNWRPGTVCGCIPESAGRATSSTRLAFDGAARQPHAAFQGRRAAEGLNRGNLREASFIPPPRPCVQRDAGCRNARTYVRHRTDDHACTSYHRCPTQQPGTIST